MAPDATGALSNFFNKRSSLLRRRRSPAPKPAIWLSDLGYLLFEHRGRPGARHWLADLAIDLRFQSCDTRLAARVRPVAVQHSCGMAEVLNCACSSLGQSLRS
jgi:hypothetical protein